MVVSVEKLQNGAALDVSFAKTFAVPDVYGLAENEADVHVVGSICGSGTGRYVLEAAADASFVAHCSRCLAPVAAQIMFKLKSVFTDSPDSEFSDDVYPVVEGRADLTEAVMSNLLIEMPVKFLCQKRCLGLCQKCGANLNDDGCGCSVINIEGV